MARFMIDTETDQIVVLSPDWLVVDTGADEGVDDDLVASIREQWTVQTLEAVAKARGWHVTRHGEGQPCLPGLIDCALNAPAVPRGRNHDRSDLRPR